MNEIYEFLNSHVSVRKFTDREISLADEFKIISTAQGSPTSSNLQAYSIVAIRDKEKKSYCHLLAVTNSTLSILHSF